MKRPIRPQLVCVSWRHVLVFCLMACYSASAHAQFLDSSEHKGLGMLLSAGYGTLSVQKQLWGETEDWGIANGAIGLSTWSGKIHFIFEGFTSSTRERHVPYTGYLPAHDVSTFYWGMLFRTRIRLLWRIYGAFGIGFIDEMHSCDVCVIKSSDEVTGDWTWGVDMAIVQSSSLDFLLGFQRHNFFAGEGDSRPAFDLITGHATFVLYRL